LYNESCNENVLTENEVLSGMEEGAADVVVVTSTSVHFPSLGI